MPKLKKESTAASETASRRILCRIPSASDCLDGVDFALLPDAPVDMPIRVSDLLTEDAADRLLQLPGFEPYAGSEATAEAALNALRKGRTATASAKLEANPERLEELMAANRALAADLHAARLELDTLRTSGDANVEGELRAQLDLARARVAELEAGAPNGGNR